MSYILYQLNEFKNAALWPIHLMGETAELMLKPLHNEDNDYMPFMAYTRYLTASSEFLERLTRIYPKPEFGLKSTTVEGKEVGITEEVILEKGFCRLLHFKKSKPISDQPKVLIVAPLSGHFATLLRDTVKAMLPQNDVYITDWKDARLVSVVEGDFDLDTYVAYLIDFIKFLGPDVNLIAVCQPAVPVMAAVSILADESPDAQPATMTLMGGPIDARVNPGKVNVFAKNHSVEWFRQHIISTVPAYYVGAGRRICPGFLLLGGFISLNLDKHQEAGWKLFENLVVGDDDSADVHKKFYDEYRSVMDLPENYYIDSIDLVFKKFALPKGKMKWNGRKVNPQAISKTALLTIEGERDDISPVGQTFAAHDLCSSIPSKRKKHLLQKGVGHYGIFNGSKWRNQIQPSIQDFINKNRT